MEEQENTSGFYKYEGEELTYAPNFVCAPSFEIFREQKDQYGYPIHGWYWFESKAEAEIFFGI